MGDLDVRAAQASRRSAPARSVSVGLVVLVVLASVALYVRIGWWRMESACSPDRAGGTVAASVSYGWSWQPLGFRCTYDDGTTSTSLWF